MPSRDPYIGLLSLCQYPWSRSLCYHCWPNYELDIERDAIPKNVLTVQGTGNLNDVYPFCYFLAVILLQIVTQGPEETCLLSEHQNPSKTSEKMGYFDRVTVSLHIL